MPIKPWYSHALQLLTCCTLMLALAHPVAPSSRGAMVPAPATPTVQSPAQAPPTLQSPAAPATTPPPAPVPATPTTPARHVWNVEYILWAPDCKQHGMIGINGAFPGPTITANAGDLIRVEVNNKLHTEGVVIHWHGIKQVPHQASALSCDIVKNKRKAKERCRSMLLIKSIMGAPWCAD